MESGRGSVRDKGKFHQTLREEVGLKNGVGATREWNVHIVGGKEWGGRLWAAAPKEESNMKKTETNSSGRWGFLHKKRRNPTDPEVRVTHKVRFSKEAIDEKRGGSQGGVRNYATVGGWRNI